MFRSIAEYKLPVGATQDRTPIDLPVDTAVLERGDLQYRMRGKGIESVVAFGDSAVAAVTTVTAKKRPDGSFSIADGAIEMFKPKSGHTHVSVIAEDGISSGGFVILTVGVGDK